MNLIIQWLLGRPDLRKEIGMLKNGSRLIQKKNDDLAKTVESLERQVDGLQKQVTHAAKATGEMAAHSRSCEVALHKARLSFSEERRRNGGRPGYQIIPEDFWFTQGAAAIKGKALATLEGSKGLESPEEIAIRLLELESKPQPQLTDAH